MKRALLLCLALPLAIACHKNKDAEGPMERAGKGVDNAAEKTGEAVKKGAEKTEEGVSKAVDATGEALENTGKKLKGEDTKTSPKSPPDAPK